MKTPHPFSVFPINLSMDIFQSLLFFFLENGKVLVHLPAIARPRVLNLISSTENKNEWEGRKRKRKKGGKKGEYSKKGQTFRISRLELCFALVGKKTRLFQR